MNIKALKGVNKYVIKMIFGESKKHHLISISIEKFTKFDGNLNINRRHHDIHSHTIFEPLSIRGTEQFSPYLFIIDNYFGMDEHFTIHTKLAMNSKSIHRTNKSN